MVHAMTQNIESSLYVVHMILSVAGRDVVKSRYCQSVTQCYTLG